MLSLPRMCVRHPDLSSVPPHCFPPCAWAWVPRRVPRSISHLPPTLTFKTSLLRPFFFFSFLSSSLFYIIPKLTFSPPHLTPTPPHNSNPTHPTHTNRHHGQGWYVRESHRIIALNPAPPLLPSAIFVQSLRLTLHHSCCGRRWWHWAGTTAPLISPTAYGLKLTSFLSRYSLSPCCSSSPLSSTSSHCMT